MTTRATGAPETQQGHPEKPTATLRLKVPANSCDCHIHVLDNNRFPILDESGNADFPVSGYRLAQKRIGTTRTVVVTPKPYITDNRCTLDAVSQLGSTTARGIAVVHPSISDAELTRLADGGIRGIRFTIGNPAQAVTTIDMIEPLATRINDLGWHVQIHMLGDQIVENADLLQRLESPIVIDHMGRLPPSEGIKHPAFRVIRRLLDKGRTWVKLAGSMLHDSSKRRPPTAAEFMEIAQAYIKAAPDRVVWGSDWPHRGEKGVPDDVERFDALARWAQDEPTWRRILVDNPQVLYDFPKSV